MWYTLAASVQRSADYDRGRGWQSWVTLSRESGWKSKLEYNVCDRSRSRVCFVLKYICKVMHGEGFSCRQMMVRVEPRASKTPPGWHSTGELGHIEHCAAPSRCIPRSWRKPANIDPFYSLSPPPVTYILKTLFCPHTLSPIFLKK